MNQHHCFLTSINLDTSNVFTRIIIKVFWCIAKLKFAFTFTGHFKSVIKGFKVCFQWLFSLQIKLLPCNRNNFKKWMPLQYLKKVSNETEESKGLRPTMQKDEISALFCNSVNSIISISKFSFRGKNYLKLIIYFNFSNKTFMQNGTDQRPFDFFQSWYTKLVCLFKGLLYCLN